MKGLIFNIQPYSLHDGPGIRTIVFLKGCPLRCRWCSNPESQTKTPQVYLDRTKCIRESGCNLCDQSCPAGALHDGILEHSLCDHCGKCAGICPSQALGVYGKWMEADEVIDLIEKDSVFYAHGKGGLTLSGGEPFAQAKFALELLKEAKKGGFIRLWKPAAAAAERFCGRPPDIWITFFMMLSVWIRKNTKHSQGLETQRFSVIWRCCFANMKAFTSTSAHR